MSIFFRVCVFYIFSSILFNSAFAETKSKDDVIRDLDVSVKLIIKAGDSNNVVLSAFNREFRKHSDIIVTDHRPHFVLDIVGFSSEGLVILSAAATAVDPANYVPDPDDKFDEFFHNLDINPLRLTFTQVWHWVQTGASIDEVVQKIVADLDITALEPHRRSMIEIQEQLIEFQKNHPNG